MANEEHRMQRPVWKNEINLNTVITVLGFLGVIFGWGYSYANLTAQQVQNRNDITRLTSDVSALQQGAVATNQDVAELKLRTTTLETAQAATSNTLHDQEKSINQIASDVRVTRTLVECLAKHDCTSGLDGSR